MMVWILTSFIRPLLILIRIGIGIGKLFPRQLLLQINTAYTLIAAILHYYCTMKRVSAVHLQINV